MNLIYIIATGILSLLYVFMAYNIPILVTGLRRFFHLRNSGEETSQPKEGLPTFSIVVPMKNEEKVAERSLKSLLKLKYPAEKREIIIVEDGSIDNTVEICEKYVRKYPNHVKLLRKPRSSGKPSSLNYAMKQAKGEIIATFDADSVPEPEALLKVAKYFENPSVVAVQGTTDTINPEENMLTKLLSYEETVWWGTYIQGKDTLNLFVPLTGSCQFIRRRVLEEVGGWDEGSLTEDVEMAARLTEKGHRIKYAPDVRSWQESPSSVAQLMRQRTRWFRGYMETALKYGKLLRNINIRNVDTEIALVAPYTFILYLIGYLVAVYSMVIPTQPHSIFVTVTCLLNILTLSILGVALMYVTKPRKVTNLLWLPIIYAYWSVQAFVALHALVQIVLKRPREWTKTTKTGTVTRSLRNLRLSPKMHKP